MTARVNGLARGQNQVAMAGITASDDRTGNSGRPGLVRVAAAGAASGAAMIALAVALLGCTRVQDVRGYVPDEELLADLQPGQQSRDQVVAMLGSPSSVATFETKSDTWYYITTRTEHFAFFDDEIIDQRVIAIDFDDAGRVKQVRRFDLDDAREVEPVERETPTRGKELGFFEQLFGNIGRFTNP